MPNHVATRMIIEGDEAEKQRLIAAITLDSDRNEYDFGRLAGDRKEYDFSRLYPMPEALKGTSSPAKIISEEEYAKQQETKEEDRFGFGGGITQKMSDELIAKYGTNNWYDWCNRNWGTKWGIYDATLKDDGTFRYDTAWSPATPMILQFSMDFPALKFTTCYADEGGGFVGMEEIQNGELLTQHDYGWDSPEGIAIRQEVGYWYEDEEE